MTSSSDLDALLGRVAQSDRAAFRVLYEASASTLFAVLISILRQRDLAEDALQDVFVRVWNNADAWRPSRGAAMAWLTTLARNRAIDILRKRGRELPLSDEAAAALPAENGDADPEVAAQWGSDTVRLRDCMKELSGEQRSSIRLAFLRGLSHSEVARATGAPIGTVKSWIRRGLAALKTCIGR
ncbi:MAG: sigma-70 family RNA polymerase sigma factor [Pseudomonadota bacterium]